MGGMNQGIQQGQGQQQRMMTGDYLTNIFVYQHLILVFKPQNNLCEFYNSHI